MWGESGLAAALSLVGSLVLFGLVLFLAWACVRWLGRRSGWQPNAQGGKVRVLERVALGPERGLFVVKAGEKVWLLGVTAQHIDNIGELDPALFPDGEPGAPAAAPFAAALENVRRGLFAGKGKGEPHD